MLAIVLIHSAYWNKVFIMFYLSRLIVLFLVQFGNCARILCFFPTPAVSHQRVFQMIWKTLAISGHDITVISPNILNDTNLKNLHEVNIDYTYVLHKTFNVETNLSQHITQLERVLSYFTMMRAPTELALEDENVQKVINGNLSFDMVLVQAIHPISFSSASMFKVPVIGKFYII